MVEKGKKGKLINICSKVLDELIMIGDLIIIDLRDIEDYNLSHIKGAKNVPFEYFEKSINSIPNYKEIVLYCDMGSTSIICSRILAKKGYVVYNLINGLKNYTGQFLVKN